MTPNQMTTNIAGLLERADDFAFKRSLLVNINAWRSTLIEQTLERSPADRKMYTREMFIDMETFDVVQGVDVCAKSRSIKQIPEVIMANGTHYDFVGSVDGYNSFGVFTSGTERFRRFQGVPNPDYDRQNGYLIVSNTRIKKVKLVGIPADPEAWFMFNCTTGDCDFWNSEYPVPGKIAQRIIQSVLSIDFRRILPHENPEVEVNESKR